MPIRAQLYKKTFHFGFSARTSRGLMMDRTCWFIKIWNEDKPTVFGLGECAPITGLSPDYQEDATVLTKIIENINKESLVISTTKFDEISEFVDSSLSNFNLANFPSIRFALECALLDLMHGGQRILFKNKFIEGSSVPINGLVWMGGTDFMLQQIEIKIYDGFRCVKLKVGGLDFERECDILQYIRRKYFKLDVTVRLDANGALKPEEALYKLKEMSKFNIHSIEQPLKPGHELLPELCRESPIPVALDEELIGIHGLENKRGLLKRIMPTFIVLKPTIHGGLSGTREWIDVAEKLGIGWWLTSALESNIGLNALAQFASEYDIKIPQGLGTGRIYEDNFQSPLSIGKGEIHLNPKIQWDLEEYTNNISI